MQRGRTATTVAWSGPPWRQSIKGPRAGVEGTPYASVYSVYTSEPSLGAEGRTVVGSMHPYLLFELANPALGWKVVHDSAQYIRICCVYERTQPWGGRPYSSRLNASVSIV